MNRRASGSIDAQWQAQEHALRDGGDRVDRLLAHALRTAPVPSPPADFAAGVVRAMRARTAGETADTRTERALLAALAAALVVAAAVSAWVYGSAWWTVATASLGRDAMLWSAFAAACLACVSIPWRRASSALRGSLPG